MDVAQALWKLFSKLIIGGKIKSHLEFKGLGNIK